jgi:uncharacterized protein
VTHILSHFPAPAKHSTTTSSAPSTDPDAPLPSSSQASTETPYINLENSYGNTALHWACLGGHLDTVKLLLSRGASPALANDKDQIPLDLAAFNNHMHVVDYFLAQSKDIEGGNAKEGGIEAVGDVKIDDEDVAQSNEQAEGR